MPFIDEESNNEIGIVIGIKDDSALVEVKKGESCTNCKLKSLCFHKGNEKTTFKIKNILNAKKGDKIFFVIEPKIRILSSFLVYIMPILLLVGTYFICKFILQLSENWSILAAILFIPLSYLILKFIDRIFIRRNLINPKMVKKI